MITEEANDVLENVPCGHNDWDDVRTRKGYKILRCRECQKKWKIRSYLVPRCMAFLHGACDNNECELLHVRRRKSTIEERYERFGNTVLTGVSCEIAQKAKLRYSAQEESLIADLSNLLDDDIELSTLHPTLRIAY